jgi:hypothetical protein
MMMGILVDGSIINPLIRTSTSISAPFRLLDMLLDGFAYQTVWMRGCNPDLRIASGRRRNGMGPGEVYRFVLAAARRNLLTRRIRTLNHDFNYFP